MKGLGRRVEQSQKCLWAPLHLLLFHMAASQIICKCSACFCIWTCLLLHQSVYCHGADVVSIGIWAQRISHGSEDGTQWFVTKDVWSLVVPQDALHHTTHQWYDKYINQVLALLEYYLVALTDFFPITEIPLFYVWIQCFHIWERKWECVHFFWTFVGHVHRHTEILKWGRLWHCLLCAFLWFNGFSRLNTIELKMSTIGTWTPI